MTQVSAPSPAAAPEPGRNAASDAPATPSTRAPRAARLPSARWIRLLAAALIGVALTFAFPPYGLWPLAAVAAGALALLTRGRSAREGAALGLAAGAGFFVPLLHWTGVYVGPFPWLLLAVVQALYFVPLGAASAIVQRRAGWPLWVACLWVAQESLRMREPFGGFPWGRLAFSQAGAPTLGWAAVAGAPAVTFAIALAGTSLASVVLAAGDLRAGASRPAALRAVAGAAVALVAVVGGALVPATTPDGPTVTVAVIQGGVPQLGLDFNAQRSAVLRNHVDATRALAARVRAGTAAAPDLVIWPENSSDLDPYADQGAAALIRSAVEDIGVPVLVGAVVGRDERTVENTGIVWDPVTGPGQRYVKRHPVPFAEYIPLRSIARRFSPYVDEVTRDFAKGTLGNTLQVGPAAVGDVICFEVGYDRLVRDGVRGGGQLITVQTNNATFGYTPQSEQQFAMSRLRAVEHGRTVLVAATSGVSGVVDPDGHVRDSAGVFTAKTFDVPVTLSSRLTLADRIGGWGECLLVAAGLLAVAVAAVPRGRTERSWR